MGDVTTKMENAAIRGSAHSQAVSWIFLNLRVFGFELMESLPDGGVSPQRAKKALSRADLQQSGANSCDQ
jgi:hypothetical protein